jgi:hypothetical protein
VLAQPLCCSPQFGGVGSEFPDLFSALALGIEPQAAAGYAALVNIQSTTAGVQYLHGNLLFCGQAMDAG